MQSLVRCLLVSPSFSTPTSRSRKKVSARLQPKRERGSFDDNPAPPPSQSLQHKHVSTSIPYLPNYLSPHTPHYPHAKQKNVNPPVRFPPLIPSPLLPFHLPTHCIPSNLSPTNRKFRALPPLTRASIGTAFLAWGTLGLYFSDTAEKKLGFSPSESDREALEGIVPRLVVVEREDVNAMGKNDGGAGKVDSGKS